MKATALDVKDGSELWTNSDFDGAGLISAFTDDGRIILCGYYSPIFYVCDKDGNTITLITMIQGWRWPYHIEIVNGYAEILCDNIDGQGLLRVNLENYEWELVVY